MRKQETRHQTNPRLRCLSFCRLLIWVGSSSIWLLNMFKTSKFFRSAMFGGTAKKRERERERVRVNKSIHKWKQLQFCRYHQSHQSKHFNWLYSNHQGKAFPNERDEVWWTETGGFLVTSRGLTTNYQSQRIDVPSSMAQLWVTPPAINLTL